MSRMPLFWRITSSTVSLVVTLSLGMELWVVVLLLILMRWVHVEVGLRVLLTSHVVGISSPSLLLVCGVVNSITEGANGLVVVSVVSRWRHGPIHVCLVQV